MITYKITESDLGSVLSTLRELARERYARREEFLREMLVSYHDAVTTDNDVSELYYTDPGTVSQVLLGRQPLPKRIYRFYAGHEGLLRQDIVRYIKMVARTGAQMIRYRASLLALVEHMDGLYPQDREYILGYNKQDLYLQDEVCELAYRLMDVVMYSQVYTK